MTFRASARFTDDWKHFDFSVDDRVATITFQRPDKLNALTFDIYADLRDLFREAPLRGDIDAIVITGEGRGFCSGGDVDEIIGELVKFDPKQLLEFTHMTGAVIQNMRECPIPIIAAVNGHEPARRHRAGSHDPGAAHAHRRSRRVPPCVRRFGGAELDWTMKRRLASTEGR